MSFFFIHIKS